MSYQPARFGFTPSFFALLVALAVASLAAQQRPSSPAAGAQQDQEQPPRIRTEVNYVRVDVYPTKDGAPVQDLGMEEFELLEDGARQTIEAFEHVVISPAGPQTLRAEANSVRQGQQMAANPRNRVFVFFLDVPHVAVDGSHRIRAPIIRLIDRILGPDDLIAVMTPEMAANQITFGRKTEVIADMLKDKWTWGVRESAMPMDSREIEYERCYPYEAQKALVQQMVNRRRERMVLDALHDLVRYLGSVREERKAILAISNGWLLYRPDPSMTNLRVVNPMTGDTEPVPGTPRVGVDEHGTLRINPPRREPGAANADQTVCDRERMYLANIDNEDYFRYLLDVANRHNASFYPIDPRGLAAFDYPIGPAPPPPLAVDSAHLKSRLESLEVLAENTDGLAVVNDNDLDRGLRRIADDLTSYYLLGYYSTNAKLDGSFRRITVRVKRPGVEVRARRGYRAATVEEVTSAGAAAATPVPESIRTVNAAIASLARLRPEQQFAINAVPLRAPGGEVTAVWIAGELQASAREFGRGATATIELTGGAAAFATAVLKPGERAFLLRMPAQAAREALDVRARVTADGVAVPLAASVRIEPQEAAAQALLFRRGATTANRVVPAADFRFSRTERLRLELPIPADATLGSGQFLDRNGQPLKLPVHIADKTDADGQRWLTADATLSAFGAGDYLVELSLTRGGTEQRVLTAIRITR